MSRTIVSLLILSMAGAPAWGLTEWSDDFQTATTYDSASILAPCYGGVPTKYTLLEALVTDIFNEQVVSGGGRFVFTNRVGVVTPPILPGRVELAVIGWFGLGTGCPGEPPPLESDVRFTNDDVCAYGGIEFTPWHVDGSVGDTFDTNGPDLQPGIANVDDDLDGTTDELDENIAARPTTVGGGYGNADGTGFQAGVDAAPGDAGIDDDGNGITDDIGETGWPSTDDGDDVTRNIWWCILNGDFSRSETVYLNIDANSVAGAIFSIYDVFDLINTDIELANEVSPGFYQPGTHYNWVFCASGTCHGAMLWTGNDMANPNETVGPAVTTIHTTLAASEVGVGFVKNVASNQYLRKMPFKGNTNFSHTFWVCQRDPTYADFVGGEWGYPSPSADLDSDRDVDVNDFLTFSGCFAGSLVPPAGGCQNNQADLDGDGDVDVNDFLTFSGCFNGSLTRPKALCFPPDLTSCP